MNPAKVKREQLRTLTDLPNVGPSIAEDLRKLGFQVPQDLVGRDPYQMYDSLCHVTGVRHDPCVIDVFLAVTRFMDGDEPKTWWSYTAERKRQTQNQT
jgi:hypothetical protein